MHGGPGVHVVFHLIVDDDGWPPVGAERVWAYTVSENTFRVDNVPWFVRDLAVGDIVEAVAPDQGSHPVFGRMVERSDHLTARLIVLRKGPMAGDLRAVADAFRALGVYVETFEQMVALDIPPGADLGPICELPQRGASEGTWEWEEGRIFDNWERVKARQDGALGP